MTGSEQKDLPKTYKIDWDEDIDDLLQSLEKDEKRQRQRQSRGKP